MTGFILDPRLEADTLPIAELGLSSLRLMNDSRWPWLILVPRIAGAVELHDLQEEVQLQLWAETLRCGRVMRTQTGCDKINSASIGNIVRQLHMHVIARREGDENWPRPVWGHGSRAAYTPRKAEAFMSDIRSALGIAA